MGESFDSIRKLIDQCSAEDMRALKAYLSTRIPDPLEVEWGVDAGTIMSAISRSSDLTKRGVRGIIAEAVFDRDVLPELAPAGWRGVTVEGDLSYDALLHKGEVAARVQIKLQRMEKGTPKLYYPKHYEKGSLYVVEVQRTRSGTKTTTFQGSEGQASETTLTFKTRPYRFGDFDILAVNMHPSCKDWKSFRYTLAKWLIPRPSDPSMIEVFQPVAANPSDVWTDKLATCLEWFEFGADRRVLAELLHRPRRG